MDGLGDWYRYVLEENLRTLERYREKAELR